MMAMSIRHVVGVVITVIVSAGAVASQTTTTEVAREIDSQVWLPLLAASNAFDAAGFLAVPSHDLVRISVDSNEIYGLDRYRSELVAGFARARGRGIKRRSDVRFLTRAHSGDLARDTGIFRSEVMMPGGETRVRFTAFEMILRREQGRWRVLVDQDTARGGAITQQDYEKGTPPIGVVVTFERK
jgi:ketosteroid isomerase-like protein